MLGDGRLAVLDHPLVRHRTGQLRDRTTPGDEFRRLTAELAGHLAYEALRGARMVPSTVDTPVASGASVEVVADRYLVVPILRAGLGMAPAIQALLPDSWVCLVGLRRDETTLAPSLYLDGLPADVGDRHVLVCDPMLATGGSALLVVELLEARGAREITVLCLIAAAPGVDRLLRAHARVRVVAAALDEQLDASGFIVPGLGDAGDRLFGAA